MSTYKLGNDEKVVLVSTVSLLLDRFSRFNCVYLKRISLLTTNSKLFAAFICSIFGASLKI